MARGRWFMTYAELLGRFVVFGIVIVLLSFLWAGAVGYMLTRDPQHAGLNPTSSAAPSAQDEAACKGESCTGEDPRIYGCDKDADDLESTLGPVKVQLRYSRACEAAWARVSTSSSSYTPWIEAAITLGGHPVRHYPINGGSWYSPMVSFHYWVRACLTDKDCTRYRKHSSPTTTTPR
jgi:Protein of unknown function (DUF2690)